MSEKSDFSGRVNQVVSLSLAAVVAGALPSVALAGQSAPQPRAADQVSAKPEAGQDRLHARVEAAIRQLRAEGPSLGRDDAPRLHLAQWRNR